MTNIERMLHWIFYNTVWEYACMVSVWLFIYFKKKCMLIFKFALWFEMLFLKNVYNECKEGYIILLVIRSVNGVLRAQSRFVKLVGGGGGAFSMDSCYWFFFFFYFGYTVYLGLKVCRHVTSMLRGDWLKLVGGVMNIISCFKYLCPNIDNLLGSSVLFVM